MRGGKRGIEALSHGIRGIKGRGEEAEMGNTLSNLNDTHTKVFLALKGRQGGETKSGMKTSVSEGGLIANNIETRRSP
jgi:hypothetical protein